jgi:hypothetical protein
MKEVRDKRNITLWLDEEEWIKFKVKVAKEKETMQGKLYELVIKYLLEK